MVLIDFHNGSHALFNPRTCSLDQVWRGSVQWRGKVFDFSQETSQSLPLVGPEDFLVNRLAAVPLLESLSLTADEPTARVRGIDLTGTSDAWLWFEERGRAPIRFELLDSKSAAPVAHFESATHVTSDDAWQWNLKRLPRWNGSLDALLTCGTLPKSIRSLRVLLEASAWSADGTPCAVRWRGYDLEANHSVRLRFEITLPDGRRCPITQFLQGSDGGGCESWFAPPLPTHLQYDGETPSRHSFQWSTP